MRSRPRRGSALAALWLLASPGCNGLATQAGAPTESPPELVEEALRDSLDAPLEPLTPPPRAEEPGVGPVRSPGRAAARFDVTAHRVAAPEFFMSLVEDTSYNLVVDPAVEGEISLELRQVTVEEALNAVRDVYGYEFRRTSYGYHVMPRGLQSRVFNVNYLNVRRTGESQTRVSSGQVSDRNGRGDDDDGGGVVLGGEAAMTSGSHIATTSHADFWIELDHALASIVGKGDGRSITLSPNTGVVVVRAMPAELRAVEDFLGRAELNLQRQVVLEAKILEIALDERFQSGVNWSQLAHVDSADILGSQIGGGTIFPGLISEIAGNGGDLDPGVPGTVIGSETSAFGGTFTLSIESDDFNAFIELLETQGDVRTLSSPRISTLNNQRAVIKVGTDEFFVTDVSTTTVTGAATTTSPDIELTPFFSGIALDVTPQVDEDGDIVIHIHPAISEVDDQNKTITVGGSSQTLPLALSTIRETDSVVRAKSGQVVVIGGLMQDARARGRALTPWLGKVPIIGVLFQHRLDRDRMSELVILLRAVAVGPDTFRRSIERTSERMRAIDQRSPIQDGPYRNVPSGNPKNP
jgi:MSHA biogenesis protein MshL